LPLLQKAFEKYRTDDSVRFVFVSLDTDPKRLQRYLDERKFANTIARSNQETVEKLFNVTDIPATFYVDRSGVIRYEARGVEQHGDAVDRVQWFIEELKKH
jgi:hypothetical protein